MAELPNNSMDNAFNEYKRLRSCLNVFQLPFEQRCEYVQSSADCEERKQLINYVEIVACHMNIKSHSDEIQIMFMLISITVLLTLTIAVVADIFFAPVLKVTAKILHMNEHLAGVTLLAFGNSSPNLFSNICASGRDSPVFANALSSALFVTMISGGLICYMSPFKLNRNGIFRDLLFFMLGALLAEYLVLDDIHVSTLEAIYLLGFYLLYIVVIAVDHILLKKAIRDLRRLLIKMKSRAHRDHVEEKIIKLELSDMMKEAGIELKVRKSGTSHMNPEIVNVDSTRTALHVPGSSRNRNLFSDFFEELMLIDPIVWHTSNLITRVFMIIRAPTYLFCLLYIPRVDVELNKHAWSKLLNCMNVIIMPSTTALIVTCFFVENQFFWLFYIDPTYMLYPLPITIPLALGVFFYSRTDMPPPFHFAFAIMSITASMVVIFICAAEISQITTLLCTVLRFSSDFMGATIGAVASSVGDIVVNTAMGMHGYGQMAFAASLGGPFCNVVFVTGITFLLQRIEAGNKPISSVVGNYGETVFIFLMLALATTLLWTLILDFQARRSVGIYSIMVYAIFLGMAILIEAEIIHSWSMDRLIPIPNV